MCVQKYTKCRNYKCNNVLEMLALRECPRRPNCETTVRRVPIDMSSERIYCDECVLLTRGQRISVRVRERRVERQRDRDVAGTMQDADQGQSSRDAGRGRQNDAGGVEGSGADLQARAIASTIATAPRTPVDAEQRPLSTYESAKSEYEAVKAAWTLVAMSRAAHAGEGTLMK
ncbi:hypothetical protein MMC07_009930 [Pseudocyphellaria aurata]|nr:hypothetical protein [Pseudocyphellaria aurata]